MAQRMQPWWWVVGAVVVVIGVLAALGAFSPRVSPPADVVQVGDEIETSRADLVVERFTVRGSTVTIEATVTNRLHVPLEIRELFLLASEDDQLSDMPTVTLGDAISPRAQPGVTATFTLEYEPEGGVPSSIRLGIVDARYVPRDDTGFGVFSNFYDDEVVAVIEA